MEFFRSNDRADDFARAHFQFVSSETKAFVEPPVPPFSVFVSFNSNPVAFKFRLFAKIITEEVKN